MKDHDIDRQSGIGSGYVDNQTLWLEFFKAAIGPAFKHSLLRNPYPSVAKAAGEMADAMLAEVTRRDAERLEAFDESAGRFLTAKENGV